jgi:hypothetical protein
MLTSSSWMRMRTGVSAAPVTTTPSYPARLSSPPKYPPTLERVNHGWGYAWGLNPHTFVRPE